MEGYHLELMETPYQRRWPAGIQLKGNMGSMISEEVLVPKKNGSQRPVKTAQSPAGEKEIQDGRGKDNQGPNEMGDWMVSIDLKDAYLSVPATGDT